MSYTDSQYERVKQILLDHRGADDPITSREIDDELNMDNIGSFPNTRECIRDIMFQERIPIVGGNQGYYVAKSEEEIAEAIEGLEGRIMNMTERKMALRRAANEVDYVDEDDDYDVL